MEGAAAVERLETGGRTKSTRVEMEEKVSVVTILVNHY